jgi:transcriptional regulator with XRE-family HTH domain
MSQIDLAKAIGISKNAMNQIEAGLTDPRASRITSIARALHCSTDYLLGIEDPDDDLVTWEQNAPAGDASAPPA